MAEEELERENYQRALKYFEDAYKCGNNEALLRIGRMYLRGAGEVKQNIHEAKKYFEKAEKAGIEKAYVLLGRLYHDEESPYFDLKLAFQNFKKAMDSGLSRYVYPYIGDMYCYGRYVAQDRRKAAEIFTRGIEEDDRVWPWPYFRLGCMYYDGDGVAEDKEKGLLYIRIAAVGDDGTAEYVKEEVLKSLDPMLRGSILSLKGIDMFSKADREKTVEELLCDAMSDSVFFEKKVLLLIAAACKGSAKAELELGYIYMDGGKGIPKNKELARFWFERAAKRPSDGKDLSSFFAKMLLKEL